MDIPLTFETKKKKLKLTFKSQKKEKESRQCWKIARSSRLPCVLKLLFVCLIKLQTGERQTVPG